MIQNCLKKTMIAALFVFTSMVFANPAEHLPANAQIYGSLNISELLKLPAAKQYIPKINKKISSSGITITDLDSTVAFAIHIAPQKNDIDVNISIVCELKKPTAAQVYNKILSGEKNVKKITCQGKPAFEEENGEYRFIQYSSNTLVFQGKLNGNAPFPALNSKNALSSSPKLLNNHIVLIADFKTLFGMFKQDIMNKTDRELTAKAEKVVSGIVMLNFQNNNQISIRSVAKCQTPKDAEDLANHGKIMLDQMIQENPILKSTLSKMYPKCKKNYVYVDTTLDMQLIEQFIKN